MSTSNPQNLTIDQLLAPAGPACLIIKAQFKPVGDLDRFQPAGFPELGHVIYPAPRADQDGKPAEPEQVCIVDSPASMANHLESLCFANATTGVLHPDLTGLSYVRCVTDRSLSRDGQVAANAAAQRDRLVCTTLTEGHRLASDYFLDGRHGERDFRQVLHEEFNIVIIPKRSKKKGQNASPPEGQQGTQPEATGARREVKADFTAFIAPDDWWRIYRTIFRYDPNSLVHGLLFAKEQIKISRLLTAHLEAFGASRVGSAGVKFDRLQKTTSGQPIFSKDEETAYRIEATFLIDLGLLRSYGRGEHGLNPTQKRLLLELSLWKVQRMLGAPFAFRSGCRLRCVSSKYYRDDGTTELVAGSFGLGITQAVTNAFEGDDRPNNRVTDVYYPANKLFQPEPEDQAPEHQAPENPTGEDEGDDSAEG